MRVEHERALLLRNRAAEWHKEGILDGAEEQAIAARYEQPWRVNGVFAQIVFFLLTCSGLGAFYGLAALFSSQKAAGVFTGVVALIVAELLIRRKQWWATGVETALWIGGLFSLISALPSRGTPESLLVIAAAFAFAGARVRQPLFGAIAAGVVAHYFEERFDLGTLAALLIAAGAMFALLRTWQRASTEWLLVFTSLGLPIVAAVEADARWRVVTIVLFLAYAALALLLGITRRHHAFLIGALFPFAVAVTELADDIPIADEAKIAIAGAFLLAISLVLTRALRDRTAGFVLTPAKLTSFDEDLQVAATIAMKPETSATPAAAPASGGQFGGAGSSGEY